MSDQTEKEIEATPPKKRTTKAEASFKVKVLRREGNMSLVQYVDQNGQVQRCIVNRSIPTAQALIKQSELDESPAYGIPFADLQSITLNASEIEQVCHQYGIWESADFDNPNALNPTLINLGRLIIGKLKSHIEEASND